MSLNDIVSMTINVNTTGVRRAGFGIPLIAAYGAAFPERVRFYTSMTGVAADFADWRPEYLAAQACFAQTPHPTRIAMGRCALPPTQRFAIRINTLADATAYTVYVNGTACTVTSGTGATRNEIADALAPVIDLVTDALAHGDFTAASTGSALSEYVAVTADAAGSFLEIETADPTYLTVEEDNADPGIATDLAAILLEDATWYGFYTPFHSEAILAAAATWIEANYKLMAYDTLDTPAATVSIGGGADDIVETLQDGAYHRSFGTYYPNNGDMFGAGWLGRYLPTLPGAAVAAFKTITGMTPVEMTDTQRTNVLAKYGNIYVEEGGIGVTLKGQAASGRFVDITRDFDWLRSEMQAAVFAVLTASDKTPYTDRGVSRLLQKVRAVLALGVKRGVLAESPAPEATAPAVADIDDADKADRLLPDVTFTATTASAVQSVDIVGNISL